jgi:hypothetical protein
MINPLNLLTQLKQDVPEFLEYEEFDELLYVDYGRLGTFLMKLLRREIRMDDADVVIKRIFAHLNRIYDEYGNEVSNLIVVSIFEAICESEAYLNIVQHGFNDNLKSLFYQNVDRLRKSL